MKTLTRPVASAMRATLLLSLLVGGGAATAATYNFILKTAAGEPQACATGAFSFTKEKVGIFPTTSPTVTLKGIPEVNGNPRTPAVPCFGADNTRTLSTGTLNVTVANVVLNGQDQGPNVVSVAGSLSSGAGSNDWTITFASDKTFRVTQNTGLDPQVGSGTYYLYNTNTVPEPQSLGLALTALVALVLARRMRRRP